MKKSSDTMAQVGRLAFRREGAMWRAYHARPSTMRGAILLGSIAVVAVTESEERRAGFIDLMRGVVADIIHRQVGIRPTFGDVRTAPEHERAGNG